MNPNLKLAGAATAVCAACCAVSIVPTLIAGTSLLAIIGAASTWGPWAAILAIPVAGLYVFSHRQAAPVGDVQTLLTPTSCACGPSCDAMPSQEKPIACTLEAGDLNARVAAIRDLARVSLRHASRTRSTLALTYEPEALEDVRDLVAKEQACCAFLDFDLRSNANGVFLTITAPASAAASADVFFDHFAPDFAASK